MPLASDPPERYAALAAHLDALASPTRLEILHALRTPLALHEIRVSPTLTRRGERPERALTRQSTTHHLEKLLEARLVQRLEGGERFVLDAQRLFALIDGLRDLARLRPLVPARAEGTLDVARDARPTLPPRPRALVAYGREDGVAYALPPREGDRLLIGRGETCGIRLDHDPFASTEHAAVTRRGDGLEIEDLHARNGTWVDWERIPPGGRAPIADGAMLSIGRSVLVIQT